MKGRYEQVAYSGIPINTLRSEIGLTAVNLLFPLMYGPCVSTSYLHLFSPRIAWTLYEWRLGALVDYSPKLRIAGMNAHWRGSSQGRESEGGMELGVPWEERSVCPCPVSMVQ